MVFWVHVNVSITDNEFIFFLFFLAFNALDALIFKNTRKRQKTDNTTDVAKEQDWPKITKV